MTALLERPLVWDEECDGNVHLYSGKTLIARGQLANDTIRVPMIWGVFVDEAHRGRGHGREVMRRLIDKATHRGYDEVSLYVESDNGPAIALYDSLGFTVKSAPSRGVTTMTLTIANDRTGRSHAH